VFWTSALLIFIGVLLLLRHILLPFVVGAALAYLLDPVVNLLIRRGMNRLVAALLILALFVIVFAGILVVIAPVLVDQLAALIGKLPGYLERLQALVADPSHSWLIKIMGGTSGGNQGSLGVLMNKLVGYVTDVLSTLWTKGEALLSLLSLFVITPVVTFYLLVDWDRVVSSLDSLIPLPQRQTVYELVGEINKALSGYVRGQLLVCAILGVYYAIGLTLAGLSFGLLIGVVVRLSDLHTLCGIADGSGRLVRRGGGAILS
jgi:predicted PurR-regulated permease PerM